MYMQCITLKLQKYHITVKLTRYYEKISVNIYSVSSRNLLTRIQGTTHSRGSNHPASM